jgi:purine-binding chemotaxis protein CheW
MEHEGEHDGQFCTFFVHGLFMGVEVTRVQEVIRYQQLTHVPLTPPIIAGLMNLRGQIVTAIDLRRRLGLPERADGDLPVNVVIRSSEGAMSLLVDHIGDVIDVAAESFERPPQTLTGDARELILGAYKLEGRLLLVLDTVRALDLADGTIN